MSAFSPRQMFLLDQACRPLREAFGDVSYGPFLCGTATDRQPYRDVDIRLMLHDDTYEALVDAIGVEAVTFLSIAVGQHIASLTGAPVDFQFQHASTANELHHGKRNPLGMRSLARYEGDGASPDAVAKNEAGEVE